MATSIRRFRTHEHCRRFGETGKGRIPSLPRHLARLALWGQLPAGTCPGSGVSHSKRVGSPWSSPRRRRSSYLAALSITPSV